MTKIVFISRFSNSYVRSQLVLRSNVLLNYLRRLVGKEPVGYDDSAIWTSDYITEFEKHKDIEFHILGQHKGMKKSFQHFVHNGIYCSLTTRVRHNASVCIIRNSIIIDGLGCTINGIWHRATTSLKC